MSGMSPAVRAWIKTTLPPRWVVRLRCLTRGLGFPRWGNLRRVRPFSDNFGFDRGTPLDRYYLHEFLRRHRAYITGRVLEIQNSGYTLRFGHDLDETHTLDINPLFAPTYLCDLAHIDDCVPEGHYDCFLLPNTLCVLRDIERCLRNALRIVRPGGVILASTAALVPLTSDMPDYWHLSADGWRELTRRAWPNTTIQVEAHGNCLAAVAAMLGLAHEELDPAELDVFDARFPVLVTLFGQRTA
jgi:SAM-dependent methyltransferase